MKNFVLNIAELDHDIYKPDSRLSFVPFIEYLKTRIAEEKTVKKQFYEFVLNRFEEHPELLKTFTPEEAVKHPELLELIYAILVPPIADENSTLWALAQPLKPVMFYGTDALYNLITDGETLRINTSLLKAKKEEKIKNNHAFIYSFVLRRLYNFNFPFRQEMIHALKDEVSGVMKYYKMNIDDRFLKATAKEPLPNLDPETLMVTGGDALDINKLEEILPISLFMFEGIAVITLTDVTEQYAIEVIKNIILTNDSSNLQYNYTEVVQALKTLAGNNDIEFGLLPMFKVNDKLVFDNGNCNHSALITTAQERGMAEEAYMTVANHYFEHPELLFFKNITAEAESKQLFLKLLRQDGVKSFALLPVFYSDKLCGVLEVYSKVDGLLNDSFFTKLEPAIPLLSQIMRNNIDAFNANIDAVIKEKFTSLQPAVQWRFNEAAWHYVRDILTGQGKQAMEPVSFKNVYPLYAAIDIRNSTAERAHALMGDMQVRFSLLIKSLTALKNKLSLTIIDEKIFLAKKWEQSLVDYSITTNEVGLNIFLENEMRDFMDHFKKYSPEAADIVDEYLNAVGGENGEANRYRRELEQSMDLINNTVNNYLEGVKGTLQESYPSYFEKYRSDGVEYDIYIGQSMAPEKPFNMLYFHNLRLWQLISMAEIARLTNGLLPRMKRPLQTTQLIFIHPDAIDISFRTDERRFDVEGAYNIRYQVIKKRIDKVRINNTEERLTQPGKIAMVYFNDADAQEYAKYIQYLQNQGILLNDLEYLELESLQGVSGLKALRVGINLDYTNEDKTAQEQLKQEIFID